MGSAHSDLDARGRRPFTAHKILIAGGFGSGKTTLVGAISEVRPLRTEEALTSASVDLRRPVRRRRQDHHHRRARLRPDHASAAASCCTCSGCPARSASPSCGTNCPTARSARWSSPTSGGSSDCFPSVNYFEKRRLPFVVAINCFDAAPRYDAEEVRAALDLDPDVPLVLCDARDVASVKQVLITLVETIAAQLRSPQEQADSATPGT